MLKSPISSTPIPRESLYGYISMCAHIYSSFPLFLMISYHYMQLISNMVSQLINKTQFTSNDQRVVNFLKSQPLLWLADFKDMH